MLIFISAKFSQNFYQFQRIIFFMSFARLLHFLACFSQPPVSPLPPGINLKGKTAIITGSKGGIGYEAARQLLGLNISNGRSQHIQGRRSQKYSCSSNCRTRMLTSKRCTSTWMTTIVLHLSPLPSNLMSQP